MLTIVEEGRLDMCFEFVQGFAHDPPLLLCFRILPLPFQPFYLFAISLVEARIVLDFILDLIELVLRIVVSRLVHNCFVSVHFFQVCSDMLSLGFQAKHIIFGILGFDLDFLHLRIVYLA